MSANAHLTARPRRLMTGRYLARHPVVVGAMALSDLVGRLAPRRASAAPPDGPLGVVVTNLAHLGDLLAMQPMLARLRNSARVSRLGLVIGSWGRPILQLGRLADTVHIVDHLQFNRDPCPVAARLSRHAATRRTAVRELQAAHYDVAIDAYPYLGNSADLLWSAGVPARLGFTSGGASTLYTRRVPFDPTQSVLANQLRLLANLIEEEAEAPGALLPGFQPEPAAEQLAADLGNYVVLHVGPGNRHKDWPSAKWIELGRRLGTDGFRLVFTGAPSEAARVAEVRTALSGKDLLGCLDLRGLATILGRARGLVAIDTMAGHLAACFQTPTAVVCSSAVPSHLWRPTQPFVRTVTHQVPCAPCNRTRGCPAMTCLHSIEFDTVYRALRDVMEAKSPR